MKRLILGLAILSLAILGTNYATTQAQTLSVQASSQGGNLPRNGVRIPLLNLALSAQNEAVTVRSITLRRSGLSSSDDIGDVWVQQNFARLTRSRQFTNDDELTLTFQSDFVIAANTTEYIDVVANLEFQGGGQTLSLGVVSLETDAQLTTAAPKAPVIQQKPTVTATRTQTTRKFQYDRSKYRIKCRNSRCQLVER